LVPLAQQKPHKHRRHHCDAEEQQDAHRTCPGLGLRHTPGRCGGSCPGTVHIQPHTTPGAGGCLVTDPVSTFSTVNKRHVSSPCDGQGCADPQLMGIMRPNTSLPMEREIL